MTLWGTHGGIKIDSVTGKWHGLTNEDLLRWHQTYTLIDIEQQLKDAADWCVSSAGYKGCKKNYKIFLSKWFKRSNDSARAAQPKRRPKPKPEEIE